MVSNICTFFSRKVLNLPMKDQQLTKNKITEFETKTVDIETRTELFKTKTAVLVFLRVETGLETKIMVSKLIPGKW